NISGGSSGLGVNITATPDSSGSGGNLFILGGGTMNATSGAIVLNAVYRVLAGSSSSNVIEFTGNQTVNGNAYLNATGFAQSVGIDSGKALTINNGYTVTENARLLNLTGKIVGGTYIFNSTAGQGSGVIASTSNLQLTSNLIFNGDDLVILAA